MSNWLFVLPFISALVGWLMNRIAFNYFINKKLPSQQTALADRMARIAAQPELFSFTEIEEKISASDGLEKIRPTIEFHIDDFLRHRLSKEMPMISMFIGERTTNQLKGIFMKEMDAIFPVVMKSYIAGLEKELDIEEMVRTKITSIPPYQFRNLLRSAAGGATSAFSWYGAVAGFVIGLIQVVLLFLFSRIA
jgi:uncharacterized membrane protein YheB (UPF0754 family)